MNANETGTPSRSDVDALIRRLLCTETDESQAMIEEEIVRLRLAVI